MITRFDTGTRMSNIKNANSAMENLKKENNEGFYSYYTYKTGFLEKTGGQNFEKTNLP